MLYGADLVELNSLLHASLQNIFDTNQANGNVATTTLQPLSSLDVGTTINSSANENCTGRKPEKRQSALHCECVDLQFNLQALFETVSFLVGQDTAAWFDLPAFKREVTALDLLDIAAKYGELICLDARHSSSDKVIKQAPHLGSYLAHRIAQRTQPDFANCALPFSPFPHFLSLSSFSRLLLLCL